MPSRGTGDDGRLAAFGQTKGFYEQHIAACALSRLRRGPKTRQTAGGHAPEAVGAQATCDAAAADKKIYGAAKTSFTRAPLGSHFLKPRDFRLQVLKG